MLRYSCKRPFPRAGVSPAAPQLQHESGIQAGEETRELGQAWMAGEGREGELEMRSWNRKSSKNSHG